MRLIVGLIAAALVAAMAVGVWHGEYFVALATVGISYARVWLFLALKKLGWPVVWKFLQPLLIRLAAWEVPKRTALWGVTLLIGVRNRRALQARVSRMKRRARGLARAHYGKVEARFGRYTKVVLGGVLVIGSILITIMVTSLYVFWYSATFFRALFVLGGWALRIALNWVKIGAFNVIALSPFRWLPRVLPARQAAWLRRYNIRIARRIIRRGRTTLPQLDRREFSFGQVLQMIWMPVRDLFRPRRAAPGGRPDDSKVARRRGTELDTPGRRSALSSGTGTETAGERERERNGRRDQIHERSAL